MENPNIPKNLEEFLNGANLGSLIPIFRANGLTLDDMIRKSNRQLIRISGMEENTRPASIFRNSLRDLRSSHNGSPSTPVRSELSLDSSLTENSALDSLEKEEINEPEDRNLKKPKDADTLINFLIKHGLQDYIKRFVDEEMELGNLLDLSDDDLRNFVPEIGYWSKLCKARHNYDPGHPNNLSSGMNLNIPVVPETSLPYSNMKEFLVAKQIAVDQYLPVFEKQGIELEELMDLSDDILKGVISKIGPWNTICKAKRELIAEFLSSSIMSNPNNSEITVTNSSLVDVNELEHFLKDLKLEKYMDVFEREEMDLDDVLSIPEHKLNQLLLKTGPVNKILTARKKLNQKKKENKKILNISNGLSVSEDESDDDNAEDMENEGTEEKTLNILLLGETGVGKSTFINSFANYLKYPTLEKALEDGNILSLIPTSFTVTDEHFQHHKITSGEESNEIQSDGVSATQSCKSYSFPIPGNRLTIRLIDTPGIGDTRGIDQDKINLENILGFISQHEDLHGICILMKPNNARLTVEFTFCIKELLCHLQKDAARNIVFVFTNSRSTFYKPGDTGPTLKKVLKEIESSPPYVNIPFVKETVYCYDNEAYRFLLARHHGIEFKGDQNHIFGESWKISVKECNRMIQHIFSLIPHKIQDTVSINEARRLIIDLSRPIADIAQNINLNIQVIQDKKTELLNSDIDLKNLSQQLRVPVIDLERVPLAKPTTVCTSQKCIEIRTIGKISKINYIRRCHDPCYLKGVTAELLNNTELLHCAAMQRTENCVVCGCSYKVHMHIYYECKEIETSIEDSTIKDLIAHKASNKVLISQSIKTLEKRIVDLTKEKEFITKAVAKFAIFLKSNAIAPYNDSFQDYLKHLISNEQMKHTTAGANNQMVIEGLEKMLACYLEEKTILDQVLNENQKPEPGTQATPITPENIKQLEQELYALKINGSKLRQFRSAQRIACSQAQQTFAETVYPIATRNTKKKKNGGLLSNLYNGFKSYF